MRAVVRVDPQPYDDRFLLEALFVPVTEKTVSLRENAPLVPMSIPIYGTDAYYDSRSSFSAVICF